MSISSRSGANKADGGLNAAIYLRVSTPKQAEKELSISDQRNQAHIHCDAKGWRVVSEYEDAGLSGTDERRPQLQRLMEDAGRPEKPFDVVVVHSLSRFFRDNYQFAFHERKLAKYGVEIVSITQDTGDSPAGGMIRQLFNVFDEYQSQETAKHVHRTMLENARQGFWNGGPPPYGYRTKVAETRGTTQKKVLEINPSEARMVREVFELCSGNLGVRAIADELNRRGLFYRRNRKFTSGLVHQILRRTAYAGRHYFNRTNSKTRKRRDPSEWVEVRVPKIIAPKIFDQIQKRLESRRPTNTPPRIVNGPTLLTDIAKCGRCGGGMTLRTGKGGRYRYYVCNRAATEGKTTCPGRSIRMERLDGLVLGQLEDRILQPERLSRMLAELTNRNRHEGKARAKEIRALRKEKRSIETKLDRLYDAIADGTIADTESFRQSISKFDGRRDGLVDQIASIDRNRAIPANLITPANVQRFGQALGKHLRHPDSALRKSYVRHFVDRIEVRDHEIRIYGPKSALAKGVAYGLDKAAPGVPRSVGAWWAHKDSNLGPAD